MSDLVDFKEAIKRDIERYSAMLDMYKSGKATTGEVDSRGRLTDKTADAIASLENIISELRSLLTKV